MTTYRQSLDIGSNPHRTPFRNRTTARFCADADLPVFPCVPTGKNAKHPLTPHGHHDATTDCDRITAWWSRWPDVLVGIPTGPGSRLWVLDVDGEVGCRSLHRLLARLGLQSVFDLTCVVGRTPSGGLHLFFRLQQGERPRNRARDIGPGLDTRGVRLDGASGGYVIAPGSILPDGRRYELVDAASLTNGGSS